MKLQEAIARELAAQVHVNYDDVAPAVRDIYLSRATHFITIFTDFIRTNGEDVHLDSRIASLITEGHT